MEEDGRQAKRRLTTSTMGTRSAPAITARTAAANACGSRRCASVGVQGGRTSTSSVLYSWASRRYRCSPELTRPQPAVQGGAGKGGAAGPPR